MRRILSVSVIALFACRAEAQPERYELGSRLKAFEAAWEKYDRPAARERALANFPKVTKQFLASQFGEAGRTLDLAAYALTTDIFPSTGRQWVWSLYAVPEARVVDGAAKSITVTVQPFYPVKGEMPKGLELQLWFTNKDVVKVTPEKFPLTVKVPIPPLGEFRGLDRKLYFLADGAKELRPSAIGISQIADLQKRIDKILADTANTKSNSIEIATARNRAMLVKQAIGGEKDAVFPPTDMPYADLLANAELMLDGKEFFTPKRHGQFWMSVSVGPKTSVDCRVFIPRGLDKAKSVPVVFALHGFGVDENMFFESYGAGQIVKECEKRGWVLVCPRGGLDAAGAPVMQLFATLAERYPLDAKRVFVVGHSMGARQALGQAESGKFAAIALLGGSGKIAKPATFATLPVFIGVGEKDSLALTGARELSKSLGASGAKAIVYKEYENLEHLLIVREALPDVFEMFDKIADK
jgi:predicted esterase